MGILQARILERVTMPSSRGSSQPRDWTLPHCRQILYCLKHQGSSRILEWVAYHFPRGSSWPRSQTRVSCIAGGFFTSWATREVRLIATPGAVAYQASQSTEFSRQEYWSGFPCSSPGDCPHLGIEPESPALQTASLLTEPPEKPSLCFISCLTLYLNLLSVSVNFGNYIWLSFKFADILTVTSSLFMLLFMFNM